MPTLDSLSQNYTIVVGAILTLLILERVVAMLIPFLQKKNGNGGVLTPAEQRDQYDKVKDLWAMHDVRDEDGVPLWYTRKHTYDVLAKLTTILDRITTLVEDSNAGVHRIEVEVRKMKDQ